MTWRKRAYQGAISLISGPLVSLLRRLRRPGVIDRHELRRAAGVRSWEIKDPWGLEHGSSEHRNESPSWVVELESATLVGRHALALDADGRLLLDSVNNYAPRLEPALRRMLKQDGARATIANLSARPRPERRLDLACSLAGYFSANYYHWTLEELPKLRFLEAYAEQSDRPPTLLLPAQAQSFHQQLLDLVGGAPGSAERWRGGVVGVDRLVAASGLGPLAGRCAWLRERVLAMPGKAEGPTFPRRILISRRETAKRRIVNEDELADALAPLGFERLELERLSVAEQARAFSRAQAVVGAHGAGLTNILYSAGDCALVELIDAKRPLRQYQRLAQAVGAPYHLVPAVGAGPHLEVAVEQTRARIERLLEGGSVTSRR